AVKYLNCDGTAVRGTEQAINDLQGALPAITAVAALGERTTTPFDIARRDIVEHQRTVGEMTSGQRGLDGGLAHQQPVERGVEFVVIDLTEAERFAQAGGRRCRRQPACGRQFGDRVEDAPDQHGEDKVATAIAVGAEDAIEADLAGGAEGGEDVTVREAAGDGEGVLLDRNNGAAFEHAAQTFDVSGGPAGEIAQSALTNLAVLAVTFAQEDGGR